MIPAQCRAAALASGEEETEEEERRPGGVGDTEKQKGRGQTQWRRDEESIRFEIRVGSDQPDDQTAAAPAPQFARSSHQADTDNQHDN